MKVLFLHQNFPAQYRHVAAALAQDKRCQVVALGEAANVKRNPKFPGVNLGGYAAPAAASPQTHHYVRPLESAVRRGQSVIRACLDFKKRGFVPDVVHAHPGWGEALFLRDVYPNAHIALYCEFYYHATGHDVGFDPEYPATLDDIFRVRIKNAASLLSLEGADSGISPTQWQRDAFPEAFRKRITVIHEGVDTTLVKPDPGARLALPGGPVLTAQDEVVTYIARNLEPYRGFHVFMRALPEIQKRRPKAHAVIVGGEGVSYGQQLPKGQTYKQKLLDEVGAKLDMSRVHFTGQVPYTTLLDVYRVSSAHVYLTYPFVLSWSLLEAMAAGCTLVASRTPPVEEVITDGRNGYLVDFFDRAALAEKIDHAIGSKKETDSMRERARRTVVDRFDLKTICLPRHLDLIRGVKPKQPARAKR